MILLVTLTASSLLASSLKDLGVETSDSVSKKNKCFIRIEYIFPNVTMLIIADFSELIYQNRLSSPHFWISYHAVLVKGEK